MKAEKIQSAIVNKFRKKVRSDKKVKNAYLLVYSDQLGIDINLAEGHTDDMPANPQQPVYMASVGKIFTSTLISILYEKGKLDFSDTIANYLDADIMDGLHVYREKDFSADIRIRHLLNQTSGLYDVFWPLLKKLMQVPGHIMGPESAIAWGKENLRPKFPPGKKHYYTDTNYYLLGLIIERITQKPFHEALRQYIFEPLNMQSAYMMGYSQPAIEPAYPLARFYLNETDVSAMPGFPGIDYAGGGVVAMPGDYLKFMQALVGGKLIKEQNLQHMMSDDERLGTGIRYGYGIWKFTTVPLLMPGKLNCWGCAGATGAFMFFHPKTGAYIIGNFNDASYRSKALRYMLLNVVKPLSSIVK